MTRLLFLVSILLIGAHAFSAKPFASRTLATKLSMSSEPPVNDEGDDFRGMENDVEYSGKVDWDAEWKKVVENKDQPLRRPKGNDKSDAEIAVTKAVNKASKSISDVTGRISIPEAPKMNASSMANLTGDWKFWIAVLVVISVGSSLLAGGGVQVPTDYAPEESYYI